MALSVSRLALAALLILAFMFTVPVVQTRTFTQPTPGCVIYRQYPNGTIYDVRQCPPQVVGAVFEAPALAIDPGLFGVGYVVNYQTGGGSNYTIDVGMQVLLFAIAFIVVLFWNPWREKTRPPTLPEATPSGPGLQLQATLVR